MSFCTYTTSALRDWTLRDWNDNVTQQTLAPEHHVSRLRIAALKLHVKLLESGIPGEHVHGMPEHRMWRLTEWRSSDSSGIIDPQLYLGDSGRLYEAVDYESESLWTTIDLPGTFMHVQTSFAIRGADIKSEDAERWMGVIEEYRRKL